MTSRAYRPTLIITGMSPTPPCPRLTAPRSVARHCTSLTPCNNKKRTAPFTLCASTSTAPPGLSTSTTRRRSRSTYMVRPHLTSLPFSEKASQKGFREMRTPASMGQAGLRILQMPYKGLHGVGSFDRVLFAHSLYPKRATPFIRPSPSEHKRTVVRGAQPVGIAIALTKTGAVVISTGRATEPMPRG